MQARSNSGPPSLKANTMNPYLKEFVRSVLHVVVPTLGLVAVVAFTTMPVSLGHHPGEAPTTQTLLPRHMT